MACPAVATKGVAATSAPIRQALKNSGAEAKGAKRPSEFSNPPINATSEINGRYVNVYRASSTARPYRSASRKKPGAKPAMT